MKFRTTIVGTGKNTTGIPVSESHLNKLGSGRRPAVKVTIGGHTYRSTVASMDGSPMISLSAENRQRAGVQAGDEVEVQLELDRAPREVNVPPDLAIALQANDEARDTWDRLSYSNKRWHVESIEAARSEETRHRRIGRSVEALAAGRVR